MFDRNEFVFHETGGVCHIADIQTAPLAGMPLDRVYYVLKPVNDQNSVIYIPVDSDKIFLRRLINREEAEALIAEIASILPIEAENAKLLRAKYVELMSLHTPTEWVRVVKTVQLRAAALEGKTARLSETERSYADAASRFLCTELAIALDLPLDRVKATINNHLQSTT